ncbi:hypothetical protein SLEP1_g50262 [Rubroshorea leprosula]|uniref:Uncharacterized protein n=1 Tax=Rubroshorea leprosula TaxID=152421 RepID=A0AAV5M0A7_9ROSI|nr:hypothetical protein SLEP1_g50262 [Rubroshorea leprosula]
MGSFKPSTFVVDHGCIEYKAFTVTNGSEQVADHGEIESEASVKQEGGEEADDKERDVKLENGNGDGDNLEENGGRGGIRSGVYFDKLEGIIPPFHPQLLVHALNPPLEFLKFSPREFILLDPPINPSLEFDGTQALDSFEPNMFGFIGT